MASINFKDAVVMNPNLKLSRPLGQIRSLYTGMIHNQTVYLTFSQYAGSSDIKLLAKKYSTLNSQYIGGVIHRDNDLPAIIQYFLIQVICVMWLIIKTMCKLERIINLFLFLIMN